jgi:hypothetical protein
MEKIIETILKPNGYFDLVVTTWFTLEQEDLNDVYEKLNHIHEALKKDSDLRRKIVNDIVDDKIIQNFEKTKALLRIELIQGFRDMLIKYELNPQSGITQAWNERNHNERQSLWFQIFAKLYEEAIENPAHGYSEDAEMRTYLKIFFGRCKTNFRKCCNISNSNLLCGLIKDFMQFHGTEKLTKICPQWTFILSQFHCFVIETKLENTMLELELRGLQDSKEHKDISRLLLDLHGVIKQI